MASGFSLASSLIRQDGIVHRIGLLCEHLFLDQSPDVHGVLPSPFQLVLPYLFAISSTLSVSSSGVSIPTLNRMPSLSAKASRKTRQSIASSASGTRVLPDGGHRVAQSVDLFLPIPVGQHDGAGPGGIERHQERPMLQEDAAGSHLGRPADLPAGDEEFIPGGKGKARGAERFSRLPSSVPFHLGPDAANGQAFSDAVADDAVRFEDIRREEGHIVAGDHGIGQFPFVENRLAAGRTPDDCDAEPPTGRDVDLPAGVLKMADGDRRLPPSVEAERRGRLCADAFPKNRLIDGHVLRGIPPPEGEQSPFVHRGFSRPPFPRSRSPDIPLCPGGPPVLPDHPYPR